MKLSRRRVLTRTVGGLSSIAIAGCTTAPDGPDPDDHDPPPVPDPPPEVRHDESVEDRFGDRFDTIIDLVDDAGADPSGEESVVPLVEAHAADSTLLVFPEGRYLVDGMIRLVGFDAFGMVGDADRGEVVLDVPIRIGEGESGRHRALSMREMTNGPLLENVDFDQSATPEAKANLLFSSAGGLEVRDVEIHGADAVETRDSADHNVSGKLYPEITDPDGVGVIENFAATGGTRLGVYKDSEGGCYIGETHVGTLVLRNWHLEGWSDNGIYASRTRGAVRVEGGVFKNNDISQVRLGNGRSYVDGATIIVDETDLHIDNQPGDARGMRGIWFETGDDMDVSGPVARNCTVRVTAVGNSQGAIVHSGRLDGTTYVSGCRIRVDADGVPAVRATASDDQSGDLLHRIVLKDVRIDGTAATGAAIVLEDRPESIVERADVRQPGRARDGIHLFRSGGTRVTGGSIETARFPVLLDDVDLDVGGCPVHVDGVTLSSSVDLMDGIPDVVEPNPPPRLVRVDPTTSSADRCVTAGIDPDDWPVALYGSADRRVD